MTAASFASKVLTWDQAYILLRSYAKVNGHARVPQAHRTQKGYALGRWVHNQRTAYRARTQTPPPTRPLPDDRVAFLEAVPGWSWRPGVSTVREPFPAQSTPQGWVLLLTEIAVFQKTHGHARVPDAYVTSSEFPLGARMHHPRHESRNGTLRPDRRADLDRFPGWDSTCGEDKTAYRREVRHRAPTWVKTRARIAEYSRGHGNPNAPRDYICPDGYRLGNKVGTLKLAAGGHTTRSLTPGQRADLEQIPGWTWNLNGEVRTAHQADRWQRVYAQVLAYGTSDVPILHVTDDGTRLGEWIADQRRLYRGRPGKSPMTPERKALLDALPGWNPDLQRERPSSGAPRLTWDKTMARVVAHTRRTGSLPTRGIVSPDGYRLGQWWRIHLYRARAYGTDRAHPGTTPEQVQAVLAFAAAHAPDPSLKRGGSARVGVAVRLRAARFEDGRS